MIESVSRTVEISIALLEISKVSMGQNLKYTGSIKNIDVAADCIR